VHKIRNLHHKVRAKSPYYIDMARLLAAPKELCTIVDAAAEKIGGIMKADRVDKVSSIELKAP